MINKFKKLEQAWWLFLVFLAGGVTFLNLSVLKYGVPTHYEASWFNICVASLLAIVFGVSAIWKSEE